MCYLAVRLHRGDDLLGSIKRFAIENDVEAAVIVCGVGCVSRWRMRDASGVNIREGVEHAEIVSLTGTISENGCHIHISLAREDLSVFGGHLTEGCIINTTCELVLAEVDDDYSFTREYDPETGYDELVIE